MKKVAVVGASGFVGSHFIEKVLKDTPHHIVAVSRHLYYNDHPRLDYRQANLYSLLELEKAIAGCDMAVYLVHSMATSSRLAQGSFQDFDFVLADNFARACKKNNIQHIIYVGGIIPASKSLSVHLKSRQEVEKVLSSRGAKLLALRCALVIGPGGSSFDILKKIVLRFPVLVFPGWSKAKTQPVFIDDLVNVMVAALELELDFNGSVDVGGVEKVSYEQLTEKVIQALGKKRGTVKLKRFPLWLVKLWICWVTRAPKQLVHPLVESLRHEMLVAELPVGAQLKVNEICKTPLDQAIEVTIERENNQTYNKGSILSQSQRLETAVSKKKASQVQSVQRILLPGKSRSKWAAKVYLKWLPSFFKLFLLAKNKGQSCSIYFRGIDQPLMVLEYSEERSSPSRQLFYVRGGLLVASSNKRARLEFREDPDKNFLITAIHQFVPALPWYIYLFTQAQMHRYVMFRFGEFIKSRSSN